MNLWKSTYFVAPDQSFSIFFHVPLLTKCNLHSPPNKWNTELQNLTNLPVLNIIYMRKEQVNYK